MLDVLLNRLPLIRLNRDRDLGDLIGVLVAGLADLSLAA